MKRWRIHFGVFDQWRYDIVEAPDNFTKEEVLDNWWREVHEAEFYDFTTHEGNGTMRVAGDAIKVAEIF